ncbi:hypothetical protein FQ707_14605 [Bacteroidaceae bacterium HV4-6-C5C]|nr:hypothetical protein FQ707_14605 [Bacteroidaceae bacterium HV4-6-C5C]
MLSGYFLLHRLIFSHDGRQRAAGIWSFSIPDIFGRTCITGTCTGSYDALALTSALNGTVVKATRSNTTDTYKGYASSFGITLTSPTVLSVNYYDDYAFIGSNGIDSGIAAYDALTGFDTRYTVSAKTFLTGTLTAQLLPNGTVSPTYLYSVMYYDYKGRVIQTKGNNPLSGGTEKAYIAYNFTGQPLQKKHIHAATGKDTQTELYTYTYDDALRLKTTQYSLNKGAAVTLASNTYDELGRLKTSTRNGQVNLATTYNYNVRSWLISSSSPLFNQTLYYNDTYAGSTARYNGNISAMSWKMSNEIPTRGYKFSYDNLSRLTAANYLENGSANDHFNTAYAYDKQGNMTSLARRGNTGTATYGDIDVLTMTYAGNQLVKAEDAGSSVSLSASMDFKNNSNAVKEYSYDANGNLIQDLNKGISSITYNLLNLPQTLTISNPLGSATNSYTYAADGRKLKTVIGSKTTDYCGSVIYENGVLKRILVEGGYIEGGAYYFYLTDHLGNNRVVANASGAVVQTNHYYPFGMSFPEGAVSSSQPYKYNGKELDTDRGLNMYDYSARYMDPVLGRFSTVDPNVESYYSDSPYSYCLNNPVNFTDPYGTDTIAVNDLNWEKFNSENDVISLNEVTAVASNNLIGTRASEPISGFWGYIGYYLLDEGSRYYSPSTNFTYKVGTDGVITGVAPMGGTPPLPMVGKGDFIRSIETLWNKTSKISAVRNAFNHFLKHSKEFPQYKNAKQYVEGTKDFLQNPPVGTLTKVRSNGDIMRYNSSTNTFAVMGSNGLPKTMFKPTDGMKYWLKQ